MVVLDNSREININLDNLLNLDLKIEQIRSPTLPLIFSIISSQNKISVMPHEITIDYYNVINTNTILEYYIVSGNYCNYKEFNILNFEMEKKYKIKLNLLQASNNFYLIQFPFYSIFKEIDFGVTNFESKQNKISYIIINLKDYKIFKLFLKVDIECYNSFNYSTALIGDYNKESLKKI